MAENDVDINALGVDGLTPLQTALEVCSYQRLFLIRDTEGSVFFFKTPYDAIVQEVELVDFKKLVIYFLNQILCFYINENILKLFIAVLVTFFLFLECSN